VATVRVGVSPSGVAVAGRRAYVANACDADAECTSFDGTVSVVDTATNTVVTTVPVGASPLGIAVDPDGTRVYVVNGCGADVTCGFTVGGTISVLDTASDTVVATIAVGQGPIAFGQFIGPAPPDAPPTTTAPPPAVTTTTTLPCTTVGCLLDAARGGACAGQTVPSRVSGGFALAARFIEQAATSPPRRATKLSRRAMKAVRQARAALKRKHGGVSPSCGAALEDVADRVMAALRR